MEISCQNCTHLKPHGCAFSLSKCLDFDFGQVHGRRGKYNKYYNDFNPKYEDGVSMIELEMEKKYVTKVKFNLEKVGSGVVLTATDENGSKWYVLRINEDGTMFRYRDVPYSMGLCVDEDGKIIEK